MKAQPSTAKPLCPESNDWSYEANLIVPKLPEDERIQLAVQRLIAGERIYFSNGYASDGYAPFRLEIYKRVVDQLKQSGAEIEETKHYDDGSSIYGSNTIGWLDGISASIKGIGKVGRVRNEY